MKHRWLRNGGEDAVYVFALGWGQSPEALPAEAVPAGADALALYAWHEPGGLPGLEGYAVRKLIAWSFGVWAAARLNGAWERALAINGTLTPVKEGEGIDPAIFRATLEQWRPGLSAAKFWRRMGAPTGPLRDDADLLAELRWFDAAVAACPAADNVYDRAWIGTEDRIFAPQAQRNAWRRQAAAVRERAMPHWCGSEVWREAADD